EGGDQAATNLLHAPQSSVLEQRRCAAPPSPPPACAPAFRSPSQPPCMPRGRRFCQHPVPRQASWPSRRHFSRPPTPSWPFRKCERNKGLRQRLLCRGFCLRQCVTTFPHPVSAPWQPQTCVSAPSPAQHPPTLRLRPSFSRR